MVNNLISQEIKGKWVVLLDDHIIASGDDIKEIMREAQAKFPNKKIVLARVPEEGSMIY
jgi:hypothetical protein